MTKIRVTALTADGDPYGNALVTVRLVDAGSGGAVGGGLVVAPQTAKTDGTTGIAIVDLTPTADVTPVGTYYAFTVNQSNPTVVRYIEVPAPNGTGDAEIPFDWDDPDLERLTATPPTHIPAPDSGVAGQVLGVVDPGDGPRYDLIDQTGGGAVDSVNGQAGVVVLDADDIGDGTTNKAYTAAEKTKLAAITGTNTGDQTLPTLSSLGAVPTSRTLAGLDLSADRTASALRTALGLVIGTDVAAQSSLAAKADLASPALTGTPTAPTPAAGTNTTAIATAAYTLSRAGSGVFGSGVDGALVLDGSSTVAGFTRSGTVYTPTRDIMATDLTVNSGVTLDLRTSWRLYATGTFTNAGTVRASGLNGGAPSAASANNWGSIGRGGAAGAGGTGAGTAGTALWDNTGGSKIAGNGGAGGLGSSGAGGTGATAAAPTHEFGAVWGFHTAPGCTTGYAVGNATGTGWLVQLRGGGGGGGGGGDGTNPGGGGGSGGNPILIVARHFVNTGTVTADGGAGGSAYAGNCGGGGGGGAGAIIISAVTHSNTGTITANGGAGGTKQGTGVNGTAGAAGTILLVTL